MSQDVIKPSGMGEIFLYVNMMWSGKRGHNLGLIIETCFFSLVQDEPCLPVIKMISGKDQKYILWAEIGD